MHPGNLKTHACLTLHLVDSQRTHWGLHFIFTLLQQVPCQNLQPPVVHKLYCYTCWLFQCQTAVAICLGENVCGPLKCVHPCNQASFAGPMGGQIRGSPLNYISPSILSAQVHGPPLRLLEQDLLPVVTSLSP